MFGPCKEARRVCHVCYRSAADCYNTRRRLSPSFPKTILCKFVSTAEGSERRVRKVGLVLEEDLRITEIYQCIDSPIIGIGWVFMIRTLFCLSFLVVGLAGKLLFGLHWIDYGL